jgi:hypothetical protein
MWKNFQKSDKKEYLSWAESKIEEEKLKNMHYNKILILNNKAHQNNKVQIQSNINEERIDHGWMNWSLKWMKKMEDVPDWK